MFSQTAFGVSAESFSYKVIAACLEADPLCATRHNILFTRSVLRNHLVKHFFVFFFVLGSWQKKEEEENRRTKEEAKKKYEEKKKKTKKETQHEAMTRSKQRMTKTGRKKQTKKNACRRNASRY